VIRFDTDGLTI